MCGKTGVSHLRWADVYAWSTGLTPPSTLPDDPATRVNVSPSRLRRKSEPDSMVWETLPVIYRYKALDPPCHAIWPFLPPWSKGRLPTVSGGKILSTANARLREGDTPFAKTFMRAWEKERRVLVVVSWFYEFDSRVHPQIPYAVFPLHQPFWVMAGLAVITVEPNRILESIGHNRSPALLRDAAEAETWLHGSRKDARELLRPHPSESMGVEEVPMEIKIPGNENVDLPESLRRQAGAD